MMLWQIVLLIFVWAGIVASAVIANQLTRRKQRRELELVARHARPFDERVSRLDQWKEGRK